jgi:hypothetical protein
MKGYLMAETIGHKADNPGLRGHSYSDDNLLKRFLVFQWTDSGRLGVKSYDTEQECYIWLLTQPDETLFQIVDQFSKTNTVVYDEKLGGKL